MQRRAVSSVFIAVLSLFFAMYPSLYSFVLVCMFCVCWVSACWCLYACVCLFVSMSVCVYFVSASFVIGFLCVPIYFCNLVSIIISSRVCVRVVWLCCLYICLLMAVFVCLCVNVCLVFCSCVCVCVCVYVCVLVCVCVCVCVYVAWCRESSFL